ncbi:Maf1 regulator-domain-containing protein [Coniochaeta sp. 2T2.1]|nr:Maf1 regulator-domain-containing protein [Coniochaeta sp. 2T2.1]
MAINYLILLSRQGKVRLAKWFTTLSPKEKAKIVKDVSQLVLSRRTRMCNFLEYKDTKVVYRRYASLFFIAGCSSDDNELITLEIIHRYVEQMDKYYGNVCELDIIFSFTKAYYILDELLLAGELQESSKKNVLRCIAQQDSLEDMEVKMKFLSLPEFDVVTNALNFDTPDCHVTGGCDLYTTKAAGSDKKLYKNIDKSLESQHAALLKFGASLSPPQRESLSASLNLSRSSPFGPLSEISSRRTFAYLIATLNASHPDYDFSHVLRPADFKREKNLRRVMNNIDSTLSSVRPSPDAAMPRNSPPGLASTAPVWGPQMWALVNKEMTLKDCTVFSYQPADDPFDEDEGAIWALHYFFFNKALKRVCYMYVRAVPVMSHSSPSLRPIALPGARRSSASAGMDQMSTSAKRSAAFGFNYDESGANKRARFWLGDRFAGRHVTASDDDMDDDDGLEWNRGSDGDIKSVYDDEEEDNDWDVSADEEEDDDVSEKDDDQIRSSPLRGVSEDIAGRMEIEA